MFRKQNNNHFQYSNKLFFILVVLIFVFFSVVHSYASTQVSLEWDPNSEPNLAGYRVYSREEGKSYDYTNPIWEGTNTNCTIYNLDETKNCFFVVRAFNTQGFESGDSNEVCLNSIELIREAEAGKLFGSFEVASDPLASNGKYVYVPNGTGSVMSGPDEAHKIEYIFNVPETGIYRIKGWVHAKNTSDDSFWVKINGSPSERYLWDVFLNTSYQEDYVMDRVGDYVNDRSNSEVVEIMMEAGINVVTIYLREDGTRLDKIELEYLESASDTINQSPIANAGPDQIAEEGQIVTLDGSNSSDQDDGIASYQWVQIGGSEVILSDSSSKVATFTAPDIDQESVSLAFELTVVDHGGLESTDSCIVNITRLNEPPQAIAGIDQNVAEGIVVALDGSSSLDIDSDVLFFSWTQTSGPEVALSDPTSSQPTFVTPDVGPAGASLTFNLTVTDSEGLKDSDSCVVNITWQNEPPTAILAEDYIEAPEGTKVTLDGSKSTDVDDGITSYTWTQVDGQPVSLSDPTANITTFIAPEADQNGTNLTFKLTVTDAGGLQSTADCLVYITKELSSVKIVEAEAGKLFGSFEVASDPLASNGQYVYVPNGTGSRINGPDEAHKIEYTFNVPETGIYRIKGWVHAKNTSDDSFWVKINGSPSEGYLWDVFLNTSYQEDYVMDRVGDYVNDRSNSEVVEIMMEAGINVVTIYLREDGTRLDKIELEYVGSVGLAQEAEAGKLFGSFEVASDPLASNGQYVHVSNGTGSVMSGPDEAHKMEYTFNVPETGVYRIKTWVHAVNKGDDSFWVKVNGSPSEGYLWDVFLNTSYQEDYVMDRVGDYVNDRSNSEVVEIMMEAGINVVTIYPREDGTRLDKIELEPIVGN